jgi:predicted nucleic acid-binding Zn ribbon protein
MAQNCRECGTPVGWGDKTCPHCGDPNPQGRTSNERLFVALIIAVPIVVALMLSREIIALFRHLL